MSNAERLAVAVLAGNVVYVFVTLALGILPPSAFLPPYGEVGGGVAGTWLAVGGLLAVADVLLALGVVLTLAREF